MKKKKGFTLSEVLVTITIIGVIAAIAIPTLMNKYRTAEVESKLKKVFTTLSQASMNAQAVGYDWGLWAETANGSSNWNNADDAAYFYNNYLRPYVSTLKVETRGSSVVAILADGVELSVAKGACIQINADIDGQKNGPESVYGKDEFIFLYCGTSTTDRPNSKIIPYGLYHNTTPEQALNTYKSAPAKCAAAIMLNNWKVPKGYPVSL